jgi:hypothetical protein
MISTQAFQNGRLCAVAVKVVLKGQDDGAREALRPKDCPLKTHTTGSISIWRARRTQTVACTVC